MMATWLQWSVGLLLAAVSTMVSGHHTVAGESAPAPLVFAGSGTNLPITRLLAEAFRQRHPEPTIEVPASLGSTGGIRAAADGAIARSRPRLGLDCTRQEECRC